MLAGAERVEGTLFGNGERTGSVDIVTLALNLYSQGIDPGLALWDIDEVVRVAEYCNRIPVHPRHPYAGELVYTAFSGSHQDAIKKGIAALERAESDRWEVPYLPIDPKDVGRSYEAVIRINSQSGKGGVAFVLEQDHGLRLPRELQIEFGRCVQRITDASGAELTSRGVWEAFVAEYLSRTHPVALIGYESAGELGSEDLCEIDFRVRVAGGDRRIHGTGNGPIAAYVDALRGSCGIGLEILDYAEHAVGRGADACAVAYVKVRSGTIGPLYGVGRHGNIVTASLHAVTSAVNRIRLAEGRV
jgi:2-isopropylmalate synthase